MGSSRLDDFVARARGLRRRDELDRAAVAALRELEAAGIRALLLKGPVLARRLYASGETRGYSDVDLLIPRRRLAAAQEALERLGYVRGEAVLGIDDVADIQHSEVWARAGEAGGPLLIDLHWRLDGCEAPDDVIWDALAAGRSSIELAGQEASVLGDDALALHVALHAAQHGRSEVKAIGDLARALERWPPATWRRASTLAEDVGGVRAFAAGLRLLPSGARVASELGLPATPDLEWKIEHRDVRPRGTFHVRAFAEAVGLRQRADVLRRSMFPTARWIRREYPWAARGRAWLVLAYARHLLRAPLWAVRAGRFLRGSKRARGRR